MLAMQNFVFLFNADCPSYCSILSPLFMFVTVAGRFVISLRKVTCHNLEISWMYAFYFSAMFYFNDNWCEYIHGWSTLDMGLQLILQWSTGILVMVCCFLERKKFSADITSKLGSSFTVIPFSIAVVSSLLFIMAIHIKTSCLLFNYIDWFAYTGQCY